VDNSIKGEAVRKEKKDKWPRRKVGGLSKEFTPTRANLQSENGGEDKGKKEEDNTLI